jgi:deoxyadenosine/deoxycytidine kinase
MSKLITVIGPSGIGKTSLVNRLAATGRFETALEQHAQRPFQALAKDDSRFTFANQMDYLLLRAEQEQTLRASSKIGLMDGGLDLDFHGFTRLFLSRNLLSQNEFDLCRRFYDLIRTNTPSPELTIRLKADEETVSGRLSRRTRINIAGAEDTALFESFLDDWLEGIHPNQILELDVTNETLEYNQSIHAILQRVSELE